MIKAISRTVESKVTTRDLLSDNELFARFIRFAAVSDKTASTYKIALRQLKKYFDLNGITKPMRVDLEQYRDGLIAAKKSPATVKLYISATRVFFAWLAQEGLYTDIANRLKTKVKITTDHKKEALTKEEAGKIIKNAGQKMPTGKRRYQYKTAGLKNLRDRAIIALMASCGLRCVEVVRADVADLQKSFGRTILWIQGKGHDAKDAQVLVPKQVEKLIREYLSARGAVAADEPLFTSTANRNSGKRIQTQSISRMVKATMRYAGLITDEATSKRYTAHSLRHTAATTMILAGEKLADVQQVLRHVNINTTMIYNNAVSRLKNQAEQTAATAIFDTIAGSV